LIKLKLSKPRESTRTSVSMSTDHSTLSPNFHSTELLNATVPTMSGSRDGETTLKPNNGTSMESQRPSRTTTGDPTLLTSNQTEDQAISDAPLPTQDGGNSSDMRVASLSMRKERLWKFKTKTLKLMLKTETSWSTTEAVISDNNGKSSMLTNTQSQRRESSMNNSVFTSKETSTLSQLYQVEDILT
jgi:hypothetical protein